MAIPHWFVQATASRDATRLEVAEDPGLAPLEFSKAILDSAEKILNRTETKKIKMHLQSTLRSQATQFSGDST
jgi:hypothetical protein